METYSIINGRYVRNTCNKNKVTLLWVRTNPGRNHEISFKFEGDLILIKTNCEAPVDGRDGQFGDLYKIGQKVQCSMYSNTATCTESCRNIIIKKNRIVQVFYNKFN